MIAFHFEYYRDESCVFNMQRLERIFIREATEKLLSSQRGEAVHRTTPVQTLTKPGLKENVTNYVRISDSTKDVLWSDESKNRL